MIMFIKHLAVQLSSELTWWDHTSLRVSLIALISVSQQTYPNAIRGRIQKDSFMKRICEEYVLWVLPILFRSVCKSMVQYIGFVGVYAIFNTD